MSQHKKTGVAIASILAVGTGLAVTSNYVLGELRAEESSKLSNFTSMAPNFDVVEQKDGSSRYYIAGQEFETTYHQMQQIRMMSVNPLGAPQLYDGALATAAGIKTNTNTIEQSMISESRLPSDKDLSITSGPTPNPNDTLGYPYRTTFEYWTTSPNATSNGQHTVLAGGVYGYENEFTNDVKDESCKVIKTINGKLTSPFTVEEKTVTSVDKVLAEHANTFLYKAITYGAETTKTEYTCTIDNDMQFAINNHVWTLTNADALGDKCTAEASSTMSSGDEEYGAGFYTDDLASLEETTTLPTGTLILTGINDQQLSFVKLDSTGAIAANGTNQKGSTDTPIQTMKDYTCPAKDYEPEAAGVRGLIELNNEKILFSSDNRKTLPTLQPMQAGKYLTADGSDRLTIGNLSETGLAKDYEIRNNTYLRIPKDSIKSDTITIPVDLSGSSYVSENNPDFTSTPVLMAMVENTSTGEKKFARLPSAYDEASKTAVAQLNIKDLAVQSDGSSYDAQDFTITLFQNELVSKGGNDKYVDYVSNGKEFNIQLINLIPSSALSLESNSIEQEDAKEVWGTSNTIKGTFDYPQLIDKTSTDPHYIITDADGKEKTTTLDMKDNGDFIINDLPEGEYDVKIVLPVKDDTVEKTVHMKVDTKTPVLEGANYDEINVFAKKVDLKLHVEAISGVKSLTLTKAVNADGEAITDFATPLEITELWNETTNSGDATNSKDASVAARTTGVDYKFTTDKAGYYTFKVVANNGLTYTISNLNLTKIYDGTFAASVEAFTYSETEAPKPVVILNDGGAQWAANRVELHLKTTITGTIGEAIRWDYYEYDPASPVTEIKESDWKPVVDEKGNPSDKFHVDNDGKHYYKFRAVTQDQTEVLPSNKNTALTETDFYAVMIDSVGPNKPTLDLAQGVVYDPSTWFKEAQDIKATFVPSDVVGSKETLMYRFVDENGDALPGSDWTAYPTDVDETKNKVTVSSDGTHYLEFMVKDELNRESSVTSAIINLDLNAPVMQNIEINENTISKILSKVTFDTFFKDYVQVSATATDGDNGKYDDQITYQYALIDKTKANLDIAGKPQYVPVESEWQNGRNTRISSDFEGIIMMRALDRAGNSTDIWFTDGIKIDRLGPVITFPDVANDTWSDETTLKVNIKDGGTNDALKSGIKADSVTWYSELTGISTPLTLDKDGNAEITGLSDGIYLISVNATDGVGHPASVKRAVKIDTVYPKLTVEGHDNASIKKSETLTLRPNKTTSGLEKITWTINGVAQPDITDFNEDGTANVTITTNGFYTFTAVSKAGRTSAAVPLDVKNLSDAKPEIEILSKVGSDNYSDGAWSKDTVSLTVKNKTADMYNLKMYYRAYKINGKTMTDITPKDGETYTDKTKNVWAQTDSIINVSETGEYLYTFMAFATNGEQSATQKINVRVDKNEVPEVVINEESSFTKDTWHAAQQSIKATYTDSNIAVKKTLEYNLDNSGWKEIAKNKALSISTNGEHKIEYRITDALNRTSKIKTVYANIDTTTPEFEYTTTQSDGSAHIDFVPQVGPSGIDHFTIQKEGSSDQTEIISNSVDLSEMGTYTVTLTSKAGKSVTKTISLDAITTVKPVIRLDVQDSNAPVTTNSKDATNSADATNSGDASTYVYKDGKWSGTGSKWTDHGVRLKTTLVNSAQAGKVTYYVNMDGIGWKEAIPEADGSLILTIGDSKDYENVVNYQIKAVSESGIESEIQDITLYIDQKEPAAFSVNDVNASGQYKDGAFLNTTQTISTDFVKARSGSSEWLEYEVKDADDNVIVNNAKQDTLTLSDSGIYTVTVKNMDDLGKSTYTSTFTVNIDKEIPTELTAKVDDNVFKEFLNNVTLGLFFQESKELELSADFGVSGTGTIYYQNVQKETDYQMPNVTNAWSKYTSAIALPEDSYGIYYFYAVDAAGNRSAVYKTDGLTVDKVQPVINVQIPASASGWSKEPYVEITTDGDTTANEQAKALNKGFKELRYTTDEAKPQSGVITFDDKGYAKIPLADGSYNLLISGTDYAGNEVVANAVTKATGNRFAINIDTVAPTISVAGHNETNQYQKETWRLEPTVGASGYLTMDASGTDDPNGDKIIRLEKTVNGVTTISGLSLSEAAAFSVTENGTYTFTVRNNVGVSASETITVNNISADLPNMEVTMDHDDGTGAMIEYKEGTWSATDVNLHIKAVKDGTFKYRINAQSSEWLESPDGEISIDAEGKNSVTVRLIVNNTLIEEHTYDIRIDKTAPEAPYVLNKDIIEMMDTWYKDTFNVKAGLDEDINGCAEWVEYSLDSGATWSKGDNVNVTMPGVNHIMFRSKDELGRISSDPDMSEVDVKIDITAPTSLTLNIEDDAVTTFLSDITFGTIFQKTQKVSASANFNESGADRFEYQLVKKGEVYDPTTGWLRIETSGNGVVSETLTTLSDGFDGVVYVRAIDNAGNISAIVNSEQLTVDSEKPIILAESMTSWRNTNEYAFSVTDAGSGIDKVTYQYTPKGSTAQKEQLAEVKEDGSVILTKLANGEGTLNIKAYDKAGNMAEQTVDLMIDTHKPVLSLALENGSIISTVNYAGQSGIKRVIVYGPAIHETDITDTLVEKDGLMIYSYTPNVSANYFVKVETNAGNSDTKELNVTTILSDKPVLKLDATYTQSNRKGLEYKEGDWSAGNVDIEVRNVADNVVAEKYYYTIYEQDGIKVKQSERELKVSDGIYLLSVSEEGTHIVAFKAVTADGVSSEVTNMTVMIDRSMPFAPVVTNAQDYEADDWYNTPQNVQATFKANTSGAEEVLKYNLDGEWTTEHELIWREVPAGGVEVSEEGKHTVRFRVEKATGSISAESTPAIVNIDTTKPNNMAIHVDDKSYRHVLNSLTFGAFFNDTSQVTIDGSFDIAGMDRIEYAIVKSPTSDTPTSAPAESEFKEYTGAFHIDPNEEVIIFARGIDKAGNISDVIYSDRLLIDNVEPTISFPDYPDGVPSKWLSVNSLRVQAEDQESGMDKVEYSGTLDGEDFKGEAIKSDDGTYLIANIPDGSFYMNITASDLAGNTYTRYATINVDTITPNFTIARDDTIKQTIFTIAEDKIQVGPSKTAKLEVSYTNAEGKTYKEELEAVNGKYSFNAIENATYSFTLTNGAGVSVTKEEVVDTIEAQGSGIKLSKNVVEQDWIDVPGLNFQAWAEPKNTSVLRYSYTEPDGTSVVEDTTMDCIHDFSFTQSGKYHFTFQSYAATDLTKIVETRDVEIWLDNDTPNAPVVQGDYDADHYYAFKQTITAINNKTSLASDEKLQYRIDPADESAQWLDGGSATIDPLTAGFTTHKVEFRVIDEVGHTSTTSEAIVNFTKASDLSVSAGYSADRPMTSIPVTIQVMTGNAPLSSLSIRNTAFGEEAAVKLTVDPTAVNTMTSYETVINQNGVYLITAKDASGTTKTMRITINNIQLMDTELNVTMRNAYNDAIKDGAWSAVDVNLKAQSSTTSDLSGMYYRIDDEVNWTKYTGTIKVSEEGEFVYHFKLTQDGKEYLKDAHVRIDKTAPKKPIVDDEDKFGDTLWKNSEATLISASLDNKADTGSPQTLKYRVDTTSDAAWKTGSVARVSGNGTHTVEFIAEDEAGHISEIKKVTVNLDASIPLMEGISAVKDSDKKQYIVEVLARDDNGLKNIHYQLVNSGGKPSDDAYQASKPELIKEDASGKHYRISFTINDSFRGYIYAKAEDLAGNMSVVQRSNLVDADFFIPAVSFPSGDMTSWTKNNSVKVYVDYGTNGAAASDALVWEAYDKDLKAQLKDKDGNPIGGTLSANGTGMYTIQNLPNGNYRVVVKAKNKADNIGEANIHVLIENVSATVTGTLGALINDDHARIINVEMSYDGNNLRPDTLAMKQGISGEWKTVNTYNSITGKAEVIVSDNGDYYFKAYQAANPESAVISDPVSVTGIVPVAGSVGMENYIKFISPKESVCDNQASGNIVNDNNGNCTFDEYQRGTSYDVNIILLNWNELSEKMKEHNLKLVSAIQVGDQISAYKDVTWNDDATSFPGAKVLGTFDGKIAKNETIVYALMKNDGSDEIVETRSMKLWILGREIDGTRSLHLDEETVNLRMNAYVPYTLGTEEQVQLVKGHEPYDEHAWTNEEEVMIEEGAYTLYIKAVDGTVTSKTITSTSSSATSSKDPLRSILKAITFSMLYKDDVTITIQSDLHDLEVNVHGTWIPYTKAIHVESDAKGMIEVRGSDDEGTVVSEFIAIN